jgi:hypothetical protein
MLKCFPSGASQLLHFAAPIVRKIADKTILNKFVCKGFNTTFVKIGVIGVPNLLMLFRQKVIK